MGTGKFWKEAAERAVKSAAQLLLLLWGVDGFNILSVDWGTALGMAAGAVVLSVLTSIVSAPVGDHSTPSLTDK